jgi:hypothetical protein
MQKSQHTIWKHFIKAWPLTAILVIITMVFTTVVVLAASGTTDAANSPALTSSYTLEDIYQRLTNGTAGSQSTFTNPAVAPGTGSMYDLNDIMSAAPALDNTNGATADQVMENQTFWGLTNGQWGLQTGNITSQTDVTGTDGSLSVNIPNGYYNNKTATAADTNLIADNIRHGVTIFGITGKYKTGWSYYTNTAFIFTIADIDILTSTDAWAIQGDDAYHWDGISWSSGISLPDRVNAIDMISSNDGWAAGSADEFLHWDGSSWRSHATGEGNNGVYDIQMLSSSNGWAMGAYGCIYHYDGSTWSQYTTVGGGIGKLTGVSMLNSSDGWAVDYYGRTFRWNGTSWSLVEDISTNELNAIDMVNTSDAWAVGESGEIYHWNGTSWNLSADVGDSTLTTVDMINSSEGWAAGDNGEIYHYDGTYWVVDTNAGSATITALAILNDNGWAGNYDGEIYVLRD